MANSNNIPVIWDKRNKDKLLNSLFPKEAESVRNKSYSSKHVSKTFDEISYEINYGENNSCGEYLDQWYSKGINANELLKYIHNKISFGSSFFYPQMFITSTLNPMNQSSPLLFMGVTAYNAISSDKQNFRYDDVKRKTLNYGDVYVKLNMRACHVNLSEPGFRFKIDASKNEILFSASYVYQDAIDSGIRNFNNNTPETNDYDEIDKKYYAVILECKDPNSFMGLSYFIEHQSFIKDSIIKAFYKAIKNAATKGELKFLYENIPDFALRELQFTEELLWSHLVELTNYDDVGVFSGWRDGSSAVINVLKAFGDSTRLYETFKKNPKFIKRVYQNLDGTSVFEKQLISNKLIFSNLITALCINNGFKGLQRVGKTFKYGKEYKFDGDVNQWITDEKQDEFFLQQLRNIPFLGADIIPIDDQIPEDNGAMYHPLDLVSIIETDSKDKTPIIVPALYIKALSDEVELQEIETNIRIGLDVLAIVLGLVVVSTTANPTVLALACADIGLAAIDGGIQAYKTDILKFEGGAEFLQTWEKIYVVGGLALAGPALIQTVLTTGAKVLRLAQMAKNVTSAHFVKTCLLKVFLEIEIANFTKNTVKIVVQENEIINATSGAFNKFKFEYLEKKGILLISGDVQKGNTINTEYGLIYKGNVVAKGEKGSFYNQIKNIARNYYREEQLVELLDEMEDNVWRYFDKELASGNIYETKSLESIYTIGSKADFEKGVKYLTEKERELYEIFVQYDKIVDVNGNLVDTLNSTSVLQDGKSIITEYAIFVMSQDGKIYLSKNYAFGKFHHSSFLAGKQVAAAGEMVIEKGIIKIFTNGSGHYKPSLEMVKKNTLKELLNRNYFSSGTNKQSEIKFNHGF